MLLNFCTPDQDVQVGIQPEGDGWLLIVEGREVPLQAEQDRNGCWLVDTHQGRRRLWVARRGDERIVFCDGRVHTFRLPDPEHDDADDLDTAGPILSADMPGKVVRVLAEMGETVQAGQPLVIMESMKMESELTAAISGTIVTIHVADGQIVSQGENLVSIEPGPKPGEKDVPTS